MSGETKLKIFSIKQEPNLNRKTITLFGISIKMSNDRNILIMLADEICLFFKKYIFLNKHKKYIQRKDKTNMRRLFITTGSISLLNSLTIMEQFSLWNNGCNDILINSGVGNSEFVNDNKKLVSIFDVNNCYSFLGSSKSLYKYLLTNYFTDYDEVYFVNLGLFGNKIPKLYNKAKLYSVDEGAYTVIAQKGVNYDRLEGIISANYMNKLDYFAIKDKNISKVIKLDKKYFDIIVKRASKSELSTVSADINDKPIIFCGTFAAVKGLTLEYTLNRQKEIMDSLVDKGYTVLFKPHPRDLNSYEVTDKFKVLNTRLPMELLDLSNVIAVVSLYSSTSIQIFHCQNTPGFVDYDTIKYESEFENKFLKEYVQDFNTLLDVDMSMSGMEIKKLISKNYETWIDSKSKLSENMNIM